MSKRRLSKHQLARIAENQQKELNIAQNESIDVAVQNKCNGRVIKHYGQHLDVESLDSGRVIRCSQRANLPKLVTGDLVLWTDDGAESGVVVAQGRRRNFFGRPGSDGIFKPVAANIDRVLVVFAATPTPHISLIDRYLVAIEQLDLNAVLILNKLDLLGSQELKELDNILSNYGKIGYNLHQVSAHDGRGIPELRQALAGKTTILVGQSGVGKSSLLNTLHRHNIADVGALSETWERGTHTTTTSCLFHMPGFDLIDSPGIREFGLGHINQGQVFEGFVEFQPFAGQCKFRDCSHRQEPACAIHAAVASGQISSERVASYFRIVDSLPEI